VGRFLNGRIKFGQIPLFIEKAVARFAGNKIDSEDDIYAFDRQVRDFLTHNLH